MRLPFPIRIPPWYGFAFAASVLVLQLLTGTQYLFSILVFFFILLSTVAFNVGGGFSRPAGAYIFFFSTLTCIAGFIAKIALGEPAQKHLHNPMLTMELYCCAMLGMLLAAYISDKITPKKGLLQEIIGPATMYSGAVGCVILGLTLVALNNIFASPEGSLLSVAIQLNRFLPLGIILGVIYEIRKSGGTRSINAPVVIGAVVLVIDGTLLNFSKETLFQPLVCWLFAAAAARYRLRAYQLVIGALALIFINQYMIPYCQYGRGFRSEDSTFVQKVQISASLLSNLTDIRTHYSAEQNEPSAQGGFFDRPEGFLDRLQMITFDDALIAYTQSNTPLGLGPIWIAIENAVPHFIWRDKPQATNRYGHEVDAIAPNDDSTAISFSPVGEGYRLALWSGVAILAPMIWLLLFVVFGTLCGDARRSPLSILAIALFAHVAPEGGLGGPLYLVTVGSVIFLIVGFTSAYVLPLIGAMVIPQRKLS